MKRHSPRDKAFLKVFADKLRKRRQEAKQEENVSYEAFANSLGITRAGFNKYLNEKSVPTLAVLEKARSEWGIEVKYGELDIDLIKRRAKKDDESPEAQMILPLALEKLTDQNITVEVGPKKPNAIELNVTIRFPQRRARR